MNDEGPFDLRDKLALEILNGILSSGRDGTGTIVSDIIYYIEPYRQESQKSPAKAMDDRTSKEAAIRLERIIRSCYKVADIMRKVRLSAFE